MQSPVSQVSQESKRLFVGNIEFNVTAEQLKTLFSQFGEVTGVRIITNRFTGRPRGYGFIEFAQDETLNTMLQSTTPLQLNNRELRVSMSKRKERPPRKSIFVGNLPVTTDQSQLKTYFSQFGEIKSCYVVQDKQTGVSRGYGAVIFVKGEQCEEVLKMKDLKIDTNTLTIRHYRTRRPELLQKQKPSFTSKQQFFATETVTDYDKGYHEGYRRALTEKSQL